MQFELDAGQMQFARSVAGFLARHHDFAQRTRDLADGVDDSRLWRLAIEELQLHALMVPADCGGHDGGGAEAAIVMEALGRRLAFDAFAEHCIVAPRLLQRLGATATLSEIAQGSAGVALGFCEAGFAAAAPLPVAHRDGARYRISGRAAMVLGGAQASHLLVRAQLNQAPALFLLAGHNAHLASEYTLIDGRRAADFVFDDVDAALPLAEGLAASDALAWAQDLGTLAACAEALGVLREMLALTVAHVSARRQFGAPLGALQVVQHYIADMALAIEQVEAMNARARIEFEQAERSAVIAAKVVASEALDLVGQTAVQLHGAAGTIEEAPISHYFRRAIVLAGKFGNAASNLSRYARRFANEGECL